MCPVIHRHSATAKTEIKVIFLYKTLPNPCLKLYSGAQCLHKRGKAPSRTFREFTDRCKIIFDSTASVEVTLDCSLWLWCSEMMKSLFFCLFWHRHRNKEQSNGKATVDLFPLCWTRDIVNWHNFNAAKQNTATIKQIREFIFWKWRELF